MRKKNMVSVIVPVYNVEKYLDRCINSILNQTYNNIELILINDGSTDSSMEIMKKYESLKNVILINQENSGAGRARNRGIDRANGDYILFVDSDDMLDNNAINRLVNEIKDNDIIIYGFKQFENDTNKLVMNSKPVDCVWSRFKYVATSSRMYNAKFFKKNKLYFSDLRIGEDVFLSITANSLTDKIVVLSESLYFNYINPTSITHTINDKKEVYDCLDFLKKIYTDVDLLKYDSKLVSFFYLKTIVQNIVVQIGKVPNLTLQLLFRKNIEWLRSNYKVSFWFPKGEKFFISFVVNMFYFSYLVKLDKILIRCLGILKRN